MVGRSVRSRLAGQRGIDKRQIRRAIGKILAASEQGDERMVMDQAGFRYRAVCRTVRIRAMRPGVVQQRAQSRGERQMFRLQALFAKASCLASSWMAAMAVLIRSASSADPAGFSK